MPDLFFLAIAFFIGAGLTFALLRRHDEDKDEDSGAQIPPRPQPIPIAQTPAEVSAIAEGLSSELADLATSVEGHSQLMCEAIGNPALVASQAQSLWASVRKLRLFSEKVLSSRRAPTTETSATDVRALLQELRQELEDYSGAGLQVKCAVSSTLPLAVADPPAVRKAMLFLVDTLLDLETDAGVLVLNASTHVEEDSHPQVEVEIRVESEDAPLHARGDRQPWALSSTAAQNLIRSLRGQLELEHRPGLCSTARVYLDAAPANAAAATEETPPVDQTNHPFGGIVIVEDDPGVRSLIAREMEKNGRRVFSCADGNAARSLFTATPERFELLILDAEARRQPGAKLAAEALERCPDLRILLLGTDPHAAFAGLKPGPQCRELRKPFGVSELREAVNQLLGTSSQSVSA